MCFTSRGGQEEEIHEAKASVDAVSTEILSLTFLLLMVSLNMLLVHEGMLILSC